MTEQEKLARDLNNGLVSARKGMNWLFMLGCGCPLLILSGCILLFIVGMLWNALFS